MNYKNIIPTLSLYVILKVISVTINNGNMNGFEVSHPTWIWLFFVSIVGGLLAFDLGVVHNKDKEIGIKESLYMSGFYITIGLLFSIFIYFNMGSHKAIEYLTGFLIEKSLSLDNIFMISIIFTSLSIENKYRHRVLFYGIIGVIVLRGIMIYIGGELLRSFEIVIYIFGLIMIVTGFVMLVKKGQGKNIEENPLLNFIRKNFNITAQDNENKFVVIKADENGKRKLFITPLMVALLFIEFADIVFAIDSVPAILIITNDIYVVYTSNIFAILGLRALYFAIDVIILRFKYMKPALAIILIFIGSKIFVKDMLHMEEFPPIMSLLIMLSIFTSGIVYSIYKTKK